MAVYTRLDPSQVDSRRFQSYNPPLKIQFDKFVDKDVLEKYLQSEKTNEQKQTFFKNSRD